MDTLSQPLQLAPEEHRADGDSQNGAVTGDTKQQSSKFDPNFTQNVINATGPKASPRIRKVFASLIQHLHDFARENEVTVDEWMAGVEMVSVAHTSRL